MLGGALKLLIGLLAASAMHIVWWFRRRSAANRLRQMDRGELCISCEQPGVQRTGNRATCPSCGYATDLTGWQQAKVSSEEIAGLTKPPDLDPDRSWD
jgi:ribosomal protein L37AE/L43A